MKFSVRSEGDTMTKALIEIVDVTKDYNPGRKDATRAISDVNLELHSGELIVITGQSGAGKR